MPSIESTDTIFLVIGASICFFLLLMLFSMGRTNKLLRDNLRLMEKHNKDLLESFNSLSKRTEEFGEEYRQLQTDLALKSCMAGILRTTIYRQSMPQNPEHLHLRLLRTSA